MVLASNEWLSNCEDDKKSATSNQATDNTNSNTNSLSAAVTGNRSTTGEVTSATTGNSTLEITTTEETITDSTLVNLTDDSMLNINSNYNNCNDTENINANNEHNTIHMINNPIESPLEIEDTIENNNIGIRQISIVSNWNAPVENENIVGCDSNLNGKKKTNSGNPPPYSESTTDAQITPEQLTSALKFVMTSNNGKSSLKLNNNFLNTLGFGSDMTAANVAKTAKQLNAVFTNINENNIESETSGDAKIVLQCETNSHPFQTRIIALTPNIECKVGRLIAKSKATESNAIFDCKVLSRNHAVIWYSDDKKFWVKDTKSSNGTFINDNKLGVEAAELHFGDVVKFGVDVQENARKEIHGCIIACIKLYYPDGQEAVSIEPNTQRSQYSGEGKISYDELHRLSLYMLEAAQREKVLKAKLFNIQNILDATRKNSSMCWQSLVAEDQLIHRIHALEKKLQFMEKNMPESMMRNEILKMLDDKTSYQHTAKEALRKVYQERCDALQMLSKMESDYKASDNECKVLREQIMNTKQSLQEVNSRLMLLEGEYKDYRQESERSQLEARELEDDRITDLKSKLLQQEMEADVLRSKINELHTRSYSIRNKDEEIKQNQALESLDAVIDNIGCGDDDDDDDDEDDEAENKLQRYTNTEETNNVVNMSTSGAFDSGLNENQHIVKTKSTMLKWLQNSDLNKKEGSVDLFNAICNANESDSSDDASPENTTEARFDEAKAFNFIDTYPQISNILQIVLKNINVLEAKICEDTSMKKENPNTSWEEDGLTLFDDTDKADIDEELQINENKSYELLKSSVIMLREAYTEICNSVKNYKMRYSASSPAINLNADFRNYKNQTANITEMKFESQDTLRQINPFNIVSIEDCESDNEFDKIDIVSPNCASTYARSSAIEKSIKYSEIPDDDEEMTPEFTEQTEAGSYEIGYKNVIKTLQMSCGTYKDQIVELQGIINILKKDKENLLEVVEQNKSNIEKSLDIKTYNPDMKLDNESENENENENENANENENVYNSVLDTSLNTTSKEVSQFSDINVSIFEEQMQDDLKTLNSSIVEQEEELITYKEQLEKSHSDNLLLRREIEKMKTIPNEYRTTILSTCLPFGVAVVAMFMYLLRSYY